MTKTINQPTESKRGDENSRRPWLGLAAAIGIVLIVAGVIIAADRADDETQPAAQPAPTAASEEADRPVDAVPDPDPGTTEPAPPPGNPVDVASDSEPALDVETMSITTGEQFVEAFRARDGDAALDLVASSPFSIRMFSADDRAGLGQLFGWFEAVNWQFEPVGCEFTEPDQVACAVLQRNDWFDVGDIAPVDGAFALTVTDGEITALSYGFDVGANRVPFGQFLDYMRSSHPDEVANMWATGAEGQIVGPRLTTDAFERFEFYTDEYVAAHTSQ